MQRKHLEDRHINISISTAIYHTILTDFGLQLHWKNKRFNSGVSSFSFGGFIERSLSYSKYVSPIVHYYYSPDQETKMNTFIQS